MGSSGPSIDGPVAVAPVASASPRAVRIVGLALGVLLLGAAAYVLSRQHEELAHAWRSVHAASASAVIGFLLLPLGNWAITSAIFWILTRRYAPVGRWEMAALMGSAWLLNMLPFKPGLVGRIAYHKAISGIPIATSMLVTLTSILTGCLGIVATLAAQVAFDSTLRGAAPPGILFPAVGAILALAIIPGVVLARCSHAAGLPAFSGAGAAVVAVLLRIADSHLWSVRYWLAFSLIGFDQPYGLCVVVSCLSQIAGQLPIQFGLREWTVGMASGALRQDAGPLTGSGVVPGIGADLLCRAAEICCALPVGIISSAWVYRRLRRART